MDGFAFPKLLPAAILAFMFDTKRLTTLPDAPGVYLMKGNGGDILYVGKAKSLRKRVRSYFSKGGESRYHIRFLVGRVADIDVIVTDTEKEALLLENTLIKEHRPRYNLDLRDDKTYFSLRLDMNEEFPRLTIVRRPGRDGARYFGPYSSASAAREVLKQLYKLFPLRHYPLESCRRRRRPCLFYQLRQCAAPCHGLISGEDYQSLAEGAALFLAGKNSDLTRLYRQRMAAAAADERYEDAARYRDLIRAIEVTVEKQKMVAGDGDTDVVGFFRDATDLSVSILFYRGGRLMGSRNYLLDWEMDDAEGLSSFLSGYYNRDVVIPDEILIPFTVDDTDPLGELLTERRGKKTVLRHPVRGTKAELVRLAARNAEAYLHEKREKDSGMEQVLGELKEKLHLTNLPRRIECYDISTIQGRYSVGSRVRFQNGAPDKAGYRRYRIRTVPGTDDFAMMHEVLSRRFRDGHGGDGRPDLIVIDGGMGQLNVLTAILEELGLHGIDAVSLAKSRVERNMSDNEVVRSDERVFLPGRRNPVVLRQNGAPLLLLARIRDEAHRFAITYHQKLRGKGSIRSSLEGIPGIGEKRKRELLKRFGSIRALRQADREQLAAVPSVSPALADAIWKALHGEEPEAP